MNTPDRELAISMIYMSPFEQRSIIDSLSDEKKKRVKEELAFTKKLKFKKSDYDKFVKKVIKYFRSGERDGADKSYLRPVRK